MQKYSVLYEHFMGIFITQSLCAVLLTASFNNVLVHMYKIRYCWITTMLMCTMLILEN